MITINSADELDKVIRALKTKRSEELDRLKTEVKSFQKTLSPFNVIKSGITGLFASPDLKSELYFPLIRVATRFISNKVAGPLPTASSQLISGALQMALSLAVSKFGPQLKNMIIRKQNSGNQQSQS